MNPEQLQSLAVLALAMVPVPLVSGWRPLRALAWVPMQAVRSIAPDAAEPSAFCGSFIQ